MDIKIRAPFMAIAIIDMAKKFARFDNANPAPARSDESDIVYMDVENPQETPREFNSEEMKEFIHIAGRWIERAEYHLSKLSKQQS